MLLAGGRLRPAPGSHGVDTRSVRFSACVTSRGKPLSWVWVGTAKWGVLSTGQVPGSCSRVMAIRAHAREGQLRSVRAGGLAGERSRLDLADAYLAEVPSKPALRR